MVNIRKYWQGPNVEILAVRVARFVAVGMIVLLCEAGALAATITVTTTADDITPNDGSVSLREAITAINAGNDLGDPDIVAQNPGTFGPIDTINFNIPGTGVMTINVGTNASASGIPLPKIIKPVVINGYSQPGSRVNTLGTGDNGVLLIQLSGASAGSGANGLVLGSGSAGSTVRGLIINQLSRNGIVIESDGNTIAGNFIGSDPTGTAPGPGNANNGVLVDGATGNSIGGTALEDRNVIAFNGADGVKIGNAVANNLLLCNGATAIDFNGIAVTGNNDVEKCKK